MSTRRPTMYTRVNWGENGEGAKVRNGMCPGEKLKAKESSQRLTDQAKAKVVKQASVDRMAANASITRISYEEEDVSSPKQRGSPRPPRHTSSKYDFVKVRVWLGDNSDHYYVLSRFLVSRMLTVTKIPNHVAIKIALELKKLLIDNSLLDVSQSDLEANLFKLMERRGYGSEYISLYKMMTRFHHQRIPLVILVCGVACAGKSTIATQLAQRLNLPNVLQDVLAWTYLQTDMVYELLRTSTDAPLATTPVWAKDFSSPEELITEFCRECRIVRKGLDGDMTKAMTDGKPVIIEGFHLDPSLYLLEKDNGTVTASQTDASVAPVEPDVFSVRDSEPKKDQSATVPGNSGLGTSHALKALVEEQVVDNRKYISVGHNQLSEEIGDRETGEVNGCSIQHAATQADHSENSEETTKDKEAGDIATSKPPIKAIVVPIVLRMAEEDHQVLLEEWIACTSVDGTKVVDEEEALISKFRIIQDYLCSFESQVFNPGLKVVDISATTFPQTLDWLHGYLLQCIEQGCTAAVPRADT